MVTPRQGEIWLVTLDPAMGHEQAGTRPALVLSSDDANASGAELVTVVPITSRHRPYPTRVLIEPPEGGIRTRSWVISEQVRTLSTLRLITRWGRVSHPTLVATSVIVRFMLEPHGSRP